MISKATEMLDKAIGQNQPVGLAHLDIAGGRNHLARLVIGQTVGGQQDRLAPFAGDGVPRTGS